MATTLADLIKADDLHPLTRWLISAIDSMKPSAKMLKADAIVMDKAVPELRKAPGGVVKIGDVMIGNSAGMGYFNGQVGKWREIKCLVKSYVQSGNIGSTVVSVATPKNAKSKKTEDEPIEIADPRSFNESMNLKNHGTEETRKIWINYALQRELNEKQFSENNG
jgi:hypothetical protein